MKAEELRIGNLIYSYQKELICKVSSTNANNWIICHESNFQGAIHQFEPIKLTADWLIKFGFKNYTLKKFRLIIGHWHKGKCGLYWRKGKGFCKSGKGIKVKYVHQLQNLYYALTGNELTTN